ncbi:hypothetical protein BH10PLA2_BH10PLA2_11240 [soil metagenome]
MTLACVDGLPLHPVMTQQGLVTLDEQLGVAILIHSQIHSIRTMLFRQVAQLPQSFLQAGTETLEVLAKEPRKNKLVNSLALLGR